MEVGASGVERVSRLIGVRRNRWGRRRRRVVVVVVVKGARGLFLLLRREEEGRRERRRGGGKGECFPESFDLSFSPSLHLFRFPSHLPHLSSIALRS